MKSPLKSFLPLLCASLPILFNGCTPSQRADLAERSYAPFEATNVYTADMLPDDIIRVAVLPVYYKGIPDTQLDNMDRTFNAELSKQNLFEVIPITRDNLEYAFKTRQFNSAEPLPSNFLALIEELFAVNAVLFVDVTDYRPYKPISLGIRSKLVDIHNGSVIWAFDTIFNSGDPHVASGAQRYHLRYHKTSYPLDSGTSVLRSPLIFSKYVAHEVFNTLPNRG